MNDTRLVLATTDGSARSHLILPHAAAFAKAIRARLAVLQVASPRDVGAQEGEALRELENAIKAELRRVAIEAEAVAVLRDEDEDVAAAILRVAAERRASALALTSHGHGGLRQALLGSVAAAVVQRGRIPVMVGGHSLDLAPAVGERYRLLLTSDGSHASAEIVHALQPLLSNSAVAVTLMRVFEHTPLGPSEEEQRAACEQQLRGLSALLPPDVPRDFFVRRIVPLGGVDTAIIEHAKAIDAMAIALSTHGYTARRILPMGGTASLLVNRSPLPLILARAE